MTEGTCDACGAPVLIDEESGAVAHLNPSVQDCAVAAEMTALVNLWEGKHPTADSRTR